MKIWTWTTVVFISGSSHGPSINYLKDVVYLNNIVYIHKFVFLCLSLNTLDLRIMHVNLFHCQSQISFVLEVSVGVYLIHLLPCFQYLFNSAFPVCTSESNYLVLIALDPRIQCLWKMPGLISPNWNPVWMWYSNNVSFHIFLFMLVLILLK